MYEYLAGRVAARTAAALVVDVSGVGYELRVPLGASFAPVGDELQVFTHLAVRDDAHVLFGFPDQATRDLFRTLLKVRGVGPSMALAVLSGLTRRELLEAIAAGDLKRLQGIKGVGKKTAEQMLLDLKDKLASLSGGLEHEPGVIIPAAPPTPGLGNIEDATLALVSIGYAEKEARKLVEQAADQVDPADLEALVRAAIRR